MIGLYSLIVAIGILVVGTILGYFTRQTIAKKQIHTVEAKIAKLVSQAKTEAKEIIFAAKEKANKALEEVKKEEQERRSQILNLEKRVSRREENLEKKTEEIEKDKASIEKRIQKIKAVKNEINKIRDQEIENLEKVSKMPIAQAKKRLLEQAEDEYQEELVKGIKKLETVNKEQLVEKAREIMTLAMQRMASSHATETTITTVALPSDDLKGRIIGKEGRNIRALEQLTGVEIIVDDTPEAIIVSGFNSMRRQIAKIALEKLMADGRIQPARIEETVEQAKGEIAEKVKEAGEAAVYDVGVAGLDPRIVQLLGRLSFRTSYGQNALLHSIEVAHLAAGLASELGADVGLVKKAGLLHDIGKAVDHEVQGTHVNIGINILKKFNVSDKIIEVMKSHHEEYPYTSIESIIIQVADAISSARPGARKDSLENYLKRLEDLEKTANSFDGVEKSYAIQAGREVRVFVTPSRINDLEAIRLARQIAQKIEQELEYPGEVRVNVIRETRAIEYAR